ncbi:pentatricopeptide repeat-containing protein [Dorcoceras hygrometricum]|uniref:Pentatricopeptide repeat-containing protein n=1 Tax=Dorcoceras hygrometricum TaxID=472368 RepID=A0A2Z7AR01_9LAMI|nr:pentatricopeptide repeat-containing protein [Dorcoceras hygrometricum]
MLNRSPPKIRPIFRQISSLALNSSSAASVYSPSTSSPFLSNLATSILESRTPKQALKVFNAASRTINPARTLKLHSAIIHFLTEAKLYVKARCLIKDLIETLSTTRKPHKVCSSIFNALNQGQTSGDNLNVFGVLIVALCEKGLVDEGYWVYRKLVKLPALQVCNALLNGILKSGRVEFMWNVYGDMVLKGAYPSEVTYGILMDAYRDRGDFAKAKELFDEMIEKGLKPTVVIYTTLIHCLCLENRMSEAESFFRGMQEVDVDPNVYTYNTLMDGYCKMANVQKVLKLYQEMLDNKVLPNFVTYCSILDLFAKMDDLLAFRSYFVHMVKLNVVPNVYIYNCILDGFCKTGDLSSAQDMYLEMEKFGISPDVFTWSILMKGYCSIGRVQDAENVFWRMKNAGLIANSVVYNTLIDGYCKNGNMEKALEICSQMVENNLQPDIVTFCTLIDGYCKVGNMDAAMGLYSEMAIKGYKRDVVVYTSLIDGNFKSGNTDAALRLHKEMIESGIASNVFTVGCLIDGMCKHGRINDAIKIFLEQSTAGFVAEEVGQLRSDNIGYSSPNNAMYSALIDGLCKDGRIFKASKFFSDLRRSRLRPEISDYAVLVKGHSISKHVVDVMMLQADMLKLGMLPNAFLYKLLHRGYQGMGDGASALKCHDESLNSSLHPANKYSTRHYMFCEQEFCSEQG